ncbi:MAG: LacI family DNA-binding transcriptional regulator [Spirochaetota bacterium]
MGIREIAKKAGVSVSTVSRVLNGTKPVSQELQEKVHAAIGETGYVADYAARSMVLKKSYTVGVIMPNTSDQYHQKVFYGIEKELDRRGYKALLCLVKDPDDRQESNNEVGYLDLLVRSRTDGIILLHESTRPEVYTRIRDNQIPMVLCNIDIGHTRYPQVRIDDYRAAYEGTEYLLGLGHRKIGFISTFGHTMSDKRIGGYRDALEAYGVSFDPHYIAYSQDTPEFTRVSLRAGKTAMRQLLHRGIDISSVFVMSDEMAIGAIQEIRETGLFIPEDISLLGFDGIELGNFTQPQLTTVGQPIEELGKQSAQLLLELISQGRLEGSDRVLPYRLIERHSCRSIL